MHYFTEDWSDCPGAEGETGWFNAEFRSYKFLDGDGGHLVELEESKQRRANRPAGGYKAENGPPDEA